MAIERSNPIPVGRYWVDATSPVAVQQFANWAQAHAASVKIEKVDDEDSPISVWSTRKTAFCIFRVTSPTLRWGILTGGLGLPNIAGSKVQRRTDIEPPPAEPKTPLDDMADSISNALSSAATLLFLGLLAYAYFKKGR